MGFGFGSFGVRERAYGAGLEERPEDFPDGFGHDLFP